MLSLVSLDPPARVLASGLLVDAQKMRAATLHAARGLLLDLLAISPLLGDAPLAKRLGESSAELARRPAKAARRWPAKEAAAKALLFAPPGGRRPEALQLQLPPETTARLREWASVKHAPLAPHLGHGSMALTRKGAPGIACEGPIFLLIRNLLGDAEHLVEAWESGGWRKPLALPALRLARLVTLAALGYADESSGDDELALDLRERAQSLERHCRDLETGDLRRAPETVAAPAPSEGSQPQKGPLGQGRMRRLVYREAWRAPAAGALRVLPLPQGPMLIELPQSLEARDAESGERLWKVDAAPGVVARGLEIFYAEPGDALVRLDAANGETRWKRRMRGAAHPARLWALPGGVARSLPGEGLALVNDAGTLSFRARLPGGAPSELVAVDRVLVAALGTGFLAGLDPADARILWKRRLQVSALQAVGGRALVLREQLLACIDPHDGATVWERDLPPGAGGLTISAGNAFLLAGGTLLSFALADGAPRSALPLPWARHLTACDDPEMLFATGDGASVPAQAQRGIVLVQRSQPALYDASEGLLVAQLPPARAAVLAPDFSCALLEDATGGDISVHRLTTHLSVV